jgi:hypothetical protein
MTSLAQAFCGFSHGKLLVLFEIGKKVDTIEKVHKAF